MAWCIELEVDGLKVQLLSGHGLAGIGHETVGFCCKDEATRKAVMERDPRILEVLKVLFQDQELWSVAYWCKDPTWWCDCAHDPDEEKGRAKFIIALNLLKCSLYATEAERANAAILLQEFEQERAEKEAKEKLVRKRRSDFQSKRPDLALALIERDGYKCVNCGAVENLTVDHIAPVVLGGSDDLENLQWLCQPCNSKKGTRQSLE